MERRLAAMLFVVLYGPFEASRVRRAVREVAISRLPFARNCGSLSLSWRRGPTHLPRAQTLEADVPLVVHGRYLDVELAVALGAIARTSGQYRRFYTGVEKVADGRYDLLLVTLDKGDQKHEHLQYKDFPLTEWLFQWQSKSSTRADERAGAAPRPAPVDEGATPLLFVRETKKDARGVTCAFRYLGPVEPVKHSGERPITIEWKLGTPLLPEWVRRWGTVA